ncbi:hypothetical protein WMF27_12115 [Sorangium sp. So ce281]|uniref:hypothetical protein n=1 Tax=unclassified Sorangium TaxID=2621164 RepID=UPI003F60AA8D
MTLLEILLFRALNVGSTSVSDRGTGVRASLAPRPNETILAFQIDTPEFRKGLQLDDSTRLSDGLIVYRSVGAPAVILLVELKGSDVARAVTQLESTFHVVGSHVRAEVMYRAVIVTNGASLPRLDELRKKLRRDAHMDLRIVKVKKGGSADLRDCLP